MNIGNGGLADSTFRAISYHHGLNRGRCGRTVAPYEELQDGHATDDRPRAVTDPRWEGAIAVCQESSRAVSMRVCFKIAVD